MKKFDIVIPTIRDLSFLDNWRKEFEHHHIIVVEDHASREIKVPEGFDVSHYCWADIDNDLGKKSWIIPKQDSGIRCYGFLKATQKQIFTIDDDCLPVQENFMAIHDYNLSTPCFPYYFNTFETSSYPKLFPRGYPLSYRKGTETAISMGGWQGVLDLDAVSNAFVYSGFSGEYPHRTEFNQVFFNNTTVPKNSLYSMCGMNLAFKTKINPIMYFGLMGRDWGTGRYDDMFAGWCSKKVLDAAGMGVKIGLPLLHHNKASNYLNNLKKEFYWMERQDAFIDFLRAVEIEGNDINELYENLAYKIPEYDKYFKKLKEAMNLWLTIQK